MRGVTRRQFLAAGAMATVAGLVRGRALWAQGVAGQSVVKTRLQTPLGILRGESTGGVRVFKGVPFAAPPVGDLRFRAPVKVAAWKDERDATKFAAIAMQAAPRQDAVGSEDCLYLNVWAPEGPGPFPVLVWVHGGGFTGGASHSVNENGVAFARQGIVCVTVAYRLGVLGFLDVAPLLGAAYAGSANNGLRDVVEALRWVQENIGAFGGDPKQVTVGGQSAGAKLSDILMGVPGAAGLFSAVISESGGAERLNSAAKATAVGRGFAATWGKDAATLKSAPAAELIAAQGEFIQDWPEHFPLRPEVDGDFLPRLPVATIAQGSMRGKRLLIGTNHDESASFLGPHPAQDATDADLGNLPLAQFQVVYPQYKALYPELNEERLRIRAVTAEEYWVPSVRAAEACVAGGGKAWMYRLDFVPTSGRMQGLAAHSEEIPMVWDNPEKNIANAAAEAALTRQVHAAWVAFLKGSAPAAAGLPTWTAYRAGTRPTMILNTTSRLEERPMEKELRLWDGLL